MQTEAIDLIQARMKRATAHIKCRTSFKWVLFLGLLICCALMQAQGGWEVTFGGDSEDQGVKIIQTVDEGYLEVGFSESFGDDNDIDIYLVRTDVDGTLIWEKHFDESYIEQPTDVIELLDENYLIAGFSNDANGTSSGTPEFFYLIKVSAKGDLLWSQRYPNNGFRQRANKIIQTSDGGYMMIGTTEPVDGEKDVMLLKLNAQAEEEWRQPFGTPKDDVGVDIEEVPGGYVFVANSEGAVGFDNDIAIYKVNELGGLISQHVYGTENKNEEVRELISTQDENLVMVGSSTDGNRAYMLKCDFNGDTLWTTEINASPFDDEFKSVIELEDGSLVAVGYTLPTTANVDILLMKLTADGDVIWKRNLGDEFANDNFGEGIAMTSDGGFVIAGWRALAGQIFFNDLVMVKVDQYGNYLTNMMKGKVFWSEDGCNPYENGDAPLEGWIVRIDGDDNRAYFGTTDENGEFRIPVDTGEYQVTLLKKNATWDLCTPFSFPITFQTTFDTLEYNFPVRSAVTPCPLLTIDVVGEPLNACSTAHYEVQYCNDGSDTAENAYVEIFLDEELNFLSASVDTSLETTNSIIIHLGDLAPLACGTFSLELEVACDGILNLQAAVVEASIYPNGPCTGIDPDWNMSSIEVTGTCEDGEITFKAKNVGSAPTDSDIQSYIVIEDHVMLLEGVIPTLPPGGEVILSHDNVQPITVNEDGATYRAIVEQSEGHPGNNYPTVAIEGCTNEGNENYTTGIVAEFPENDQDAFIDIEVQEIYLSSEASALRSHPRGYQDSIISPTTDIEYTVLFTNTGADTLDRLVIRDTLPAALDFSSLQVGPASHPYDFELYDGGVLKITFDNMVLVPDGSSEDATSRGYVKFSLSQKQNQPLGTIIENRAAVYFDYLVPELTEMKRHVVACENFLTVINGQSDCLLVDIEEPPVNPNVYIRVLPNPLFTSAQFIIEGCCTGGVELILRDALGRQVRRESHQGSSFIFQRGTLASAIYFYEIYSEGTMIQTGKLLVQ